MGEFDIILCGKQAIDGDTGQVGPGLASQLGITQLTYVFKIVRLDPGTGTIAVERLLEEGREIVEAKLPALLTVVKNINQPRSTSLFTFAVLPNSSFPPGPLPIYPVQILQAWD